MATQYTVFQARAGDHNDLAMPGAAAIGRALAARTGVAPTVIGTPEPATDLGWRAELAAALPALHQLQRRLEQVLAAADRSVAATSRCAASMATLPVVARYHPSACVVWFDSHADLNTPTSTTTGYLGGLALAAPAGLWDSGLGAGLGLGQLVLVGQRDLDPFERHLIDTQHLTHLAPQPDLVAKLVDAIAGRPVYLHLDCDVLDPGIVPTDYVHPDGLTLEDFRACCEALAGGRVIGVEIAEFQNAWTAGGTPVSPEPLLEAMSCLLA